MGCIHKSSLYAFIHVICIASIACNSFDPLTYYAEESAVNKNDISYKTYHFETELDHFDFSNNKKFQMRYLVNDDHWHKDGGPIFFYTGNEGLIELFAKNTGFMWEIAPEFKAMVVFAEHRYYGKTLPFGPDTYKDSANLKYLTSEQALADYAELITHIKKNVTGAAKSPVIAFGGSYAAVLTAWLRMKYPNIVIGGLSSSAPYWAFMNVDGSCKKLDQATTVSWKRSPPACLENIQQAYKTIDELAVQDGGLEIISKAFKLCKPLKSKQDIFSLKLFLSITYMNYAMVDYPYPANFIADLPAWPVREACGFLDKPMKGKDLMDGLSKVTNMFYNDSGNAECLNTGLRMGHLDSNGLSYQVCTEFAFPICGDGSGVFLNMTLGIQQISDYCYVMHKIRPRLGWSATYYWGKNMKAASNIIFSNGELDPWGGVGVHHSQSSSVVVIDIKDGAHHLDLRWKDKKDPPSVRIARYREIKIMRKWLDVYYLTNQ